MDAAIITSIVTSLCTLIGVIITVLASASKQKMEMEIAQRQQQKEIDEIKKQLNEHNNYATTIPVIQTELKFLREDITEIKSKIGA